MDNIALVNRFYQAFSENDGKTMADFYDENATFQDDVFGKLNAVEVKPCGKCSLQGTRI